MRAREKARAARGDYFHYDQTGRDSAVTTPCNARRHCLWRRAAVLLNLHMPNHTKVARFTMCQGLDAAGLLRSGGDGNQNAFMNH